MTAEPTSKGPYEPQEGDHLLVWPGFRAAGIEPREAEALSGPVRFGGTDCVRVRYLSGRRIGGTDYIALTNAQPALTTTDEETP